MREWIVSLIVRANARLSGDEKFVLQAGPDSSVPISAVRLRNHFLTSSDGGGALAVGLVAEARGMAASGIQAVAEYSGYAASLLQLASLAANAFVDEQGTLLAYSPPDHDGPGQFLEQKSCMPFVTPTVMNSVSPVDLGNLAALLTGHADEDFLRRAVAHYAAAVRALDPINRVMAAEHLFMATENIRRALFQRMCREAGLPERSASKHQLAVAAGYTPRSPGDRQHLSDYDGHLRREYIFGEDGAVHARLKESSDAFEHGYGDFGVIRESAKTTADKAFGYVRRALLCEIGLTADDPLVIGETLGLPVGGWHPIVKIEGEYTESSKSEWPDFHGVNSNPEISAVHEDVNGKRSFDVDFSANALSLLPGQNVDTQNLALSYLYPQENGQIGRAQVECPRSDS